MLQIGVDDELDINDTNDEFDDSLLDDDEVERDDNEVIQEWCVLKLRVLHLETDDNDIITKFGLVAFIEQVEDEAHSIKFEQ